MKILIAQTLFLGDLILTLPLVQRLKRERPQSQIDFLVHAKNVNILKNHPDVTRTIAYSTHGEHRGLRGIIRLFGELRQRRYDVVLVLPGSVRTAFLVYLAGIPRRIGTDQSSGMLLFDDAITFRREARHPFPNRIIFIAERVWKIFRRDGSFVSLFLTDIVHLRKELHASARYCALLGPLGIDNGRNESPRLYPAEEDRRVVEQLIGQTSGVVIGVAPGSVWNTKRWPQDHYAEVIIRISRAYPGVTFVFVGGEEDVPICRGIQSKAGEISSVDCSGRLTPLQSAAALQRCRLLITNDTAPMHIAAAMGIPCVAIYGPTVPAFGFTPFGDRHVIVEHPSLWCRPCTPHGGHRCPTGTHACMRDVSPETVFAAVRNFLN